MTEYIMPNKDREKKNAVNSAYYHRNKERLLQKQRGWYEENKEVVKPRMIAASKEWKANNFEKSILHNVRARCQRSGMDFNLELEDIVIPERCPYLQIPITRITGQGKIWSNPSIDRKDPTKGYVKGNVEIISYKANVMKSDATAEQLLIFAQSIMKRN